ncbi:uncharacterized protein VTP21DRAFT_9773 [Calcarisporiella thermophila]|uniref:uncharacterized protein n=1 Tax=Calcarisporiella thermophila TaxID=911321 RepID=UPI0037422048
MNLHSSFRILPHILRSLPYSRTSLLSPRSLFPVRTPSVCSPLLRSFHQHSSVFQSNNKSIPPSTTNDEESKPDQGRYLISFTCKVCHTRTAHTMSKQAYHNGVVLIQCPSCQNRHLIADHLGWFRDGSTTIEDLMRERGENIRRHVADGTMEWVPEVRRDEEEAEQAAQRMKLEEAKKQE